ncbi:SHOCT domain-containing protein [Acinetobacter sp. TSRC1-2]|uniref:SHOCT domain-containing protein n=1 Tax=unclassified Acinetobacter TaxID=196816 RepID=UPI003CF5C475
MYKLFFIVAVLIISSCSSVPPIQLASKSKSPFENAIFANRTVILDQPTKRSEESYRIFRKAATGFVSLQTVRENAEHASITFCERKNKVMHGLTETAAKPPYLLRNFPRVELVFECIEKSKNGNNNLVVGKYEKLAALKKLLDEDVLTEQEFEKEKTKVLIEN